MDFMVYMTESWYAAKVFYLNAIQDSLATKIDWDHTSIRDYSKVAYPNHEEKKVPRPSEYKAILENFHDQKGHDSAHKTRLKVSEQF